MFPSIGTIAFITQDIVSTNKFALTQLVMAEWFRALVLAEDSGLVPSARSDSQSLKLHCQGI